MNELGVYLMCLCIPVLGLISAGGYLFIDHLLEKRRKAKWHQALANQPQLKELLDTHNKLWEVYDKKSELANAYRKQIDHLLGNLTYLPSYECEWRKNTTEEYKKMYFYARTEADKWYEAYCKANDALNEYCEQHKIQRRD